MEAFFDPAKLDLNHIQVIVRGMYAVAEADEVHQAEMVMLRGFYDACREEADGLTDFEDLIRQPFNQEHANDVLDSDELKDIFLSSCILLAFADGKRTDEENRALEEFRALLDVPPERYERLENQVRDHLLGQLSKIENIDALREVAGELK